MPRSGDEGRQEALASSPERSCAIYGDYTHVQLLFRRPVLSAVVSGWPRCQAVSAVTETLLNAPCGVRVTSWTFVCWYVCCVGTQSWFSHSLICRLQPAAVCGGHAEMHREQHCCIMAHGRGHDSIDCQQQRASYRRRESDNARRSGNAHVYVENALSSGRQRLVQTTHAGMYNS